MSEMFEHHDNNDVADDNVKVRMNLPSNILGWHDKNDDDVVNDDLKVDTKLEKRLPHGAHSNKDESRLRNIHGSQSPTNSDVCCIPYRDETIHA